MTDDAVASRRVLLGEITTVHGIRGEVVVRSYTANPSDIAAYGALETAQGQPLPMLHVIRTTERGVIVRIAGIADRTAAEGYRGTQLWIARDRLPVAADGEFYHADLIGLRAIAGDGSVVGTIIAVENFGAGDLLEVALAQSKLTEYVPFTNDFVPTIDLAAGTATVVMPTVVEDDDPIEDGPADND